MGAVIRSVRSLPTGGARVAFHLAFEVEGAARPAAVADVVYVYLP
jgi:hypothetical protein